MDERLEVYRERFLLFLPGESIVKNMWLMFLNHDKPAYWE